MKRLRRHATYSNVAASLALFLALTTGGAYAASQLGKNSVGKKQLRKEAVTSRAIKNDGIAIRDLRARTRERLGTTEHAHVNSDATLTIPSSGQLRNFGTAKSARLEGPNEYVITFKRDISTCTHTATVAIGESPQEPINGTASIVGRGGPTVTVATYDAAGNPAPAGFNLIVAC